MNYMPLLNASPAIHIHLAATILALALGAFMLIRRKGTTSHRLFGWIWVALMLVAAISSFWITGLRGDGFSPIHILSVVVLVSVPAAIFAIRNRRVNTHRRVMQIVFFSGLVLPGLLTLLPGRLLGRLMTDGLALLAQSSLALAQ
ncbi:DUF2306 domain-containing protein [Ferrovibrio sp.]|uniref:DUF2306 domain-containing protein n=1 Tax=Ferrovibrio sp. TaxID=1917215 RepID=UPI000CB83D5A|nr:DUF2306 domain-containing protein [Ferrovibrio sp.]PJI42026.1 MAG: hypothetical protein CTR53_06140 [Ferrovibrio sp.]